MYERYCKLRDSKGLNDAEVAKYGGFPKSTFSDWKKGKSCPKLFKLVKIAECLDCSLDYLVTGKEHHSVVEEATKDLALSKMDSRIKDYDEYSDEIDYWRTEDFIDDYEKYEFL